MKKIFLATLVFLFSSSIFAQNIGNNSDRLGDKQLKTAVMQDKSKKLNIWRNTYNSTKLKNTSMTIDELYAQNGTVSYQAIVNVRYQYTVRESNK